MSCARSPAASTRRSWPRAACGRALKALARRSPIPVDLQVQCGRAAARAGRGQRVLRRRRGADQRGQARARLGRHRHRRGRRRRPARRGPRRRRRRRRLHPRHRPGRPQGPRGGARRPDLPRQPARGGDQPARGAPAHRRERRRHLPLARGPAPAARILRYTRRRVGESPASGAPDGTPPQNRGQRRPTMRWIVFGTGLTRSRAYRSITGRYWPAAAVAMSTGMDTHRKEYVSCSNRRPPS